MTIRTQSAAKQILSLLLVLVLALGLAPAASAATDPIPLLTGEEPKSSRHEGQDPAYFLELLKQLSGVIEEHGLYSFAGDNTVLKALAQYFSDHPAAFDTFVNYMFQQHDKYSYYLPGDQYSDAFTPSAGYGGIGIELEVTESGGHLVRSVFWDSPAEEAGLLPGDRVIAIDGQNVEQCNLDEIGDLLRGETGTEVSVTVRREGVASPITVSMTRVVIQRASIEFKMLEGSIPYIAIKQFDSFRTYIEFRNLYQGLQEDGATSVIIDVRDNPGGNVGVLLAILEAIVPDKGQPLFSLVSRSETEAVSATGGGWCPENLYVLINYSSASAAEMFAGALQDGGYATVIGIPSHGKAHGQYHLEQNDGSVAIITTFAIELPVQGSYDQTGIIPDIEVEIAVRPYTLPAMEKLVPGSTVRLGSSSKNVLALEQRLKLIGLFDGEPDMVFDVSTMKAVKKFQEMLGLKVDGIAGLSTLKELDTAVKTLASTATLVDTQLERALALALEAQPAPSVKTIKKAS